LGAQLTDNNTEDEKYISPKRKGEGAGGERRIYSLRGRAIEKEKYQGKRLGDKEEFPF